MRGIYLVIMASMVLFACKKDKGMHCDPNGKETSGFQIGGQWKLIATSSYRAPGGQGPWQTVGLPASQAIIQFSNDSIFLYNDYYLHKEQDYDRYKMTDSVEFTISASPAPQGGNFPIYHATVKVLDANTIQLQYMGVDAGLLEKYSRD
jgi:hypothetical protein